MPGSECGEFAMAQTAIGADKNERPISGTDRCCEPTDFIRSEEPRILVWHLGERQVGGGISRKQFGANSDFERLAQQSCALVHAARSEFGVGEVGYEPLRLTKADLVDSGIAESGFEVAAEDRLVPAKGRGANIDAKGGELLPPIAEGGYFVMSGSMQVGSDRSK